MAYRNTFFRWLFLYSLTFGLTYVLKLFTYLCPETGHIPKHFPAQGGSEENALPAVHPHPSSPPHSPTRRSYRLGAPS